MAVKVERLEEAEMAAKVQLMSKVKMKVETALKTSEIVEQES